MHGNIYRSVKWSTHKLSFGRMFTLYTWLIAMATSTLSFVDVRTIKNTLKYCLEILKAKVQIVLEIVENVVFLI